MAQGPKGELEFAIPELVEVKQVSYLWHACTGFLTACSGLLSCLACFCWHWAQLRQQQTKKVGGAAQLEDGSLRCYKREDTRKADELHGLTRRVMKQYLHSWCL